MRTDQRIVGAVATRARAALPWIAGAAAALAVWYPLSVAPARVHLSVNTPLHVYVLEHLRGLLDGGGEALGVLPGLDAPHGFPVRVVAWPVLAAALPWVRGLGGVAALNLGVTASLLASVAAMSLLLGRLGLGPGARAAGAVAWATSPLLCTFLANGQYENHAGFAIPLLAWGVLRGGPVGLLGCAAGLAGAAFSSPYQLVPALLAVAALAGLASPRGRAAPLALAGLASLACYAYYAGPGRTPGGSCAPTTGSQPALLSDMLGLGAGAPPPPPPGAPPPGPPPLALGEPPPLSTLVDPSYPDVVAPFLALPAPDASAYLGIATVAIGVAGLCAARRRPEARALAALAAGSVLLALGDRVGIAPGWSVDLPLPGDLQGLLPGIRQMGTTYRFLTGASFALAVGVALAVEAGAERATAAGRHAVGGALAVVVAALLVGDWACLGTGGSLVASAAPTRVRVLDAAAETGAVLVVGSPEPMSPEKHRMLGLLHGRPVVDFCTARPEAWAARHPALAAGWGVGVDPAAARADLATLADEGVGYVVVVPNPWDRGDRTRIERRVADVLGPPDAQGDGLLGYRTVRPPGTAAPVLAAAP